MTAQESHKNFSDILSEVEQFVEKYKKEEGHIPFKNSSQLIFRGESQCYETFLLPKLFRPEVADQFSEAYLYQEFQRTYPQYFNTCHNELDWLNIMQHHGVPTRLLDWTYSLPVALYFATDNKDKDEDEDGVLWVQADRPDISVNYADESNKFFQPINKINQLILLNDEDKINDWFLNYHQKFDVVPSGYFDNFPYKPKLLHDRIKNQHGLFTISIGKNLQFNGYPAREIVSSRITCLSNQNLIRALIWSNESRH